MTLSKHPLFAAAAAAVLFAFLPLGAAPASAEDSHGPRITSSAPALALAGYEYSYKVAAVDDRGDQLSYSLGEFPPGMTIDFSTGAIRWTPEPNQTGVFPVTVSVTDGKSSARQAFNLTVATGKPPPPFIRIAYPGEGARANRSLYIVGEASSAPGAPEVRTVEVRLDSGPWVSAGLAGDGWSYLLDTSRSKNGPHRVAVRAYDGTAHSAEAALNLTYDNPRSVLLDYPLSADPSPVPFIILVVIILAAAPPVIHAAFKGRGRRAQA
jgi:hypothetical protein